MRASGNSTRRACCSRRRIPGVSRRVRSSPRMACATTRSRAGIPAQFNDAGTELIAYSPGQFPSPGPSIPFSSGGDGYYFRDLGACTRAWSARPRTIAHYDLTPDIRLSTELLYSKVEGEDPRSSIPSNTILNSAATGSGPIPIAAANPFLTAGGPYLDHQFPERESGACSGRTPASDGMPARRSR